MYGGKNFVAVCHRKAVLYYRRVLALMRWQYKLVKQKKGNSIEYVYFHYKKKRVNYEKGNSPKKAEIRSLFLEN